MDSGAYKVYGPPPPTLYATEIKNEISLKKKNPTYAIYTYVHIWFSQILYLLPLARNGCQYTVCKNDNTIIKLYFYLIILFYVKFYLR